MKKLLFFILVSLTTSIQANDLFRLSLPENIELKGTYSSDVVDNGSFHIILMKEKKNDVYRLKPVFVASGNQVTEFEEIRLSYLPNIVSHHSDESISSFVAYNSKEDLLSLHNFNRITNEYTSSVLTDVTSLSLSFRLEVETWLFDFEEKGETITYHRIGTDNNISKKSLNMPEEFQKLFKKFKEITPINQNEYVIKGALSDVKAILQNEKLLFTIDDEKNNKTDVVTINLNGDDLFDQKTFITSASGIMKVKDYNTYLFEDKLYTILSGKKDFQLSLYDLNTETLLKRYSLSSNISKVHNNPDNAKGYLNYISKSRIRPTVAINETKEGNLEVTFDYADKNSYNYNYDWWWHHQWMFQQQMFQQQIMQQQMMRQIQQNLPSRFGPNVDGYDITSEISFTSTAPEPIVIIMDTNGTILPNARDTSLYRNVDKKKNLKSFQGNRDYRSMSAIFTTYSMRYIYQDRKTKDIIIKSKRIN